MITKFNQFNEAITYNKPNNEASFISNTAIRKLDLAKKIRNIVIIEYNIRKLSDFKKSSYWNILLNSWEKKYLNTLNEYSDIKHDLLKNHGLESDVIFTKVDTEIFKDEDSKELYKKTRNNTLLNDLFKYTTTFLKKTDVKVINMYELDNDISNILKKGSFYKPNPNQRKDIDLTVKRFNNLNEFLWKNYMYFVKIINDNMKDVDVIITPKTSSTFNSIFLENIKGRFPSKSIYIDDNFFIKDVSSIELDEDWLKNNKNHEYYSFDKEELKDLKKEINRWINKLEPKRKKIIERNLIIEKIDKLIKNRRDSRGRKSLEQHSLEDELEKVKIAISNIPIHGKNNVQDEFGEVINWQIKKFGERTRLAIKHFMSFNPEILTKDEIKKEKERFNNLYSRQDIINNIKDKKIVVFDDNYSSGATLDDICLRLIEKGVKKENILCITLGTISGHAMYGKDKTKFIEHTKNEKIKKEQLKKEKLNKSNDN